jgi:carbon storage regulator
MLVLSRKVGQKIIIDDIITVQIVSISGNKIRLGIVAPPDIEILREELAAPTESWRSAGPTGFQEMVCVND